MYIAAGGEARTALIRAFNEKYGIKVEAISASGRELATKILTERKAGLYLGDVYVGGAKTQVTPFKPEKVLDPLEPVLILPEVTDPKKWWNERLPWVDPDHMIFTFTLYPGTTYAINTTMVKKEEVKSYKDLLDPRWKGKIVMGDPTLAGGPVQKWFVALAYDVIKIESMSGMDFMRALAKQEPAILKDRRLQVEWVAHGKYPITIAPDTPSMTDFINAGAPIAYVNPVEGNFLTSGYGGVSLINRAPHPNAARVFINWLLTKEGQMVYTRALPYNSTRLDVPTDHIDALKLRQPGVAYVNLENEDYLLKEDARGAIAKEIFAQQLK